MSALIRSLLLVPLVGALLIPVAPLQSCATVGKGTARIGIASEAAIIVWDARTKTEHFIRRAAFRTNVYDFGFLVPTPTQPELGEVKDSAFSRLEPLLIPKVVYKRPLIGFPFVEAVLGGVFMSGDKSKHDRAEAGVRILDAQRVAGYDAVVLEADSPIPLNDWLGKNGYTSRPALVEWLAPYVRQKWKITAFKIAGDAKTGGGGIDASAVRLSFKADHPFYPYREPKDAREIAAIEGRATDDGRFLRVFFIGDERVSGWLDLPEEKAVKSWSAQTKFSARIDGDMVKKVREDLKMTADQIPDRPWVTIFDDTSSPRQGTNDLYFFKDDDQSEVLVSPVTHVLENSPYIPLDVVAFFLLVGLGAIWLFRRLRGVAPAQRAM